MYHLASGRGRRTPLILLLVLLIAGTGCSHDHGPPSIQIFDSARVWSRQEEIRLRSQLTPIAADLRADIVLVSADSVPTWRLPVAGDEAGKVVVPRNMGWWARRRAHLDDNDVVFFVTREPQIVQIRYGGDFTIQVAEARLDHGPVYRNAQSLARAGAVPDLLASATFLREHWRLREDIPRWKRWFIGFARSEVGEIVQDVALPDLRIWYRAMTLLAAPVAGGVAWITGAAPLWLLLLFCCGIILEKAFGIVFAFGGRLVGRFSESEATKAKGELWARLLGAFTSKLLVTLPGISVIFLTLSGRLEDSKAIAALAGTDAIANVAPLSLDFRWYHVIALSLLFFALTRAGMMYGSRHVVRFARLSESAQRLIYNEMPVRQRAVMDELIEMASHATDVNHTASYESAPFSTFRDALLMMAARDTFKIFLALCVLPGFIAAWPVFRSCITAVPALRSKLSAKQEPLPTWLSARTASGAHG